MSCPCLFASDLHGSAGRYRTLFEIASAERPRAILLGGDLLPGLLGAGEAVRFIAETVEAGAQALRASLGPEGPRIFLIPGNDDPAVAFAAFERGAGRGLWRLLHVRRDTLCGRPIFGYAYVPPTPFTLKDWERYDVSRFTDPGCVSPEAGRRTVKVDPDDVRFGTIAADLEALAGGEDLARSLWLFHAPPYRTDLDRAALDGRCVDHVPLDVNVGSIAVRRFIEARQPSLTLHGHVHESVRLTGNWRQQLGSTWMLSAAHDGPELALVRFDLDRPEEATRQLL